MTTPALFSTPHAPGLKVSTHFAATSRGPKPSYTAYNVKGRVQCEECVWTVHEARGVGGAYIRGARVKRTAGGEAVLLCHGHADLWKNREAS